MNILDTLCEKIYVTLYISYFIIIFVFLCSIIFTASVYTAKNIRKSTKSTNVWLEKHKDELNKVF